MRLNQELFAGKQKIKSRKDNGKPEDNDPKQGQRYIRTERRHENRPETVYIPVIPRRHYKTYDEYQRQIDRRDYPAAFPHTKPPVQYIIACYQKYSIFDFVVSLPDEKRPRPCHSLRPALSGNTSCSISSP